MRNNLLRAGTISLALLTAASLGGCVTDSNGQIDVGASISSFFTGAEKTIENDLPTACAAISSADSTFQTIVTVQQDAGKPLAASVISDEKAAVDSAKVACANPGSAVSAASLLATAVGIYATVMADIAAAQKQSS